MLQEVTGVRGGYRGYKGLQRVKGGYKGLQGVTGGYKRLQGVTDSYRWLEMVTEGLQLVIGWLISTTSNHLPALAVHNKS